MFAEFEHPVLGNETIDLMRDLQLAADHIDDPHHKTQFVVDGIETIPGDELFDQVFQVESLTVIGSLETVERSRRFIFSEGMRFIGRAAALNYFRNPSELVDCLTVTFVEPCVLRPEVLESADFELFTFQVPVLAIDSLELAA
jgi:hypothetical protein